jgi:hypothetical protein
MEALVLEWRQLAAGREGRGAVPSEEVMIREVAETIELVSTVAHPSLGSSYEAALGSHQHVDTGKCHFQQSCISSI